MREPKIDPGFFQDHKGKPSMMRLISYHGARLGRYLVAVGVIITPLELFVFRTGTTTGVIIIGIGTALFGSGEWAKATQSGREGS